MLHNALLHFERRLLTYVYFRQRKYYRVAVKFKNDIMQRS
jgi:hypothetical protein